MLPACKTPITNLHRLPLVGATSTVLLNLYGEFVSLYSCLIHTKGVAQVAELRQWRHHYYSLVVWGGMKLCFTVVGCAQWEEGYQLVTVDTHGNFIVLSHWDSKPPVP